MFMKSIFAFLFSLFAMTVAYAQTPVNWPSVIVSGTPYDFGNGPMKLRVIQGTSYIFSSQGSGIGSTSGSSTLLTLTTTPTTPPCIGCQISGAGISSGTTVVAFNGTTSVTLSAAMTVAPSTAVTWGAACPSVTPAHYIQASAGTTYYEMYTQARVCGVSPGGPSQFALTVPYEDDNDGGGIPPLPSGQMFVGSVSNVATAQAISGAGDCTVSVSNIGVFTFTCTKTNGVAFAPSATVDTTNAANINAGTLALTRMPQLGANSLYLNATNSPGQPTSFTAPACANDGAHAWVYVNGTGIQCATITGGGGAVSSVSNSDGTLTISPTTGNVVASLALGHVNTWTGLQTFSAAASASALTLSGITGSTQCLHVNTSGLVSGTAADCGIGTVTSISITPGTGITQSGSPITTSGAITVNVDKATNANIWGAASNKVLTADSVFGSAANMQPLIGTTTVTPDFTQGMYFTFAPTSATNFMLANPTLTSAMPGRSGCIWITQPATPVMITYGTFWWSAGGSSTKPLTATAGAQDRICYTVVTTTEIDFTIGNGIAH